MKGYATIGTIYSLREETSSKRLLWAVTENNGIDKTSTLTVIEDCPENGKTVTVDAKWLYSVEPLGPILPPNGEIVIENEREFIKPLEEEKSATARLK